MTATTLGESGRWEEVSARAHHLGNPHPGYATDESRIIYPNNPITPAFQKHKLWLNIIPLIRAHKLPTTSIPN